ncbi:MAG: FMN-binding protein [Planctomycetes bacterium]|nr:FMN-binding protein [Planctomycetota bacterium]
MSPILAVKALLPLLSLLVFSTGSIHASGTDKALNSLTRDEALQLAFPGCRIEKVTHYLKKEQRKLAEELAKVKVERRVVHAYRAMRKDEVVGTAYFDVHKVRTHKQVVMFVVDKARSLRRIELLTFAEPVEYIPSGKWYRQFIGKKLNDQLSLKRGIRGVTGATLTARATTQAARRVLALHAVVEKPKPVTRL